MAASQAPKLTLIAAARLLFTMYCVERSTPSEALVLAETTNLMANQSLAHWHRHDAARAADLVAFLNFREIAQQHRAHLVFIQVHGDARDIVRELDQFA